MDKTKHAEWTDEYRKRRYLKHADQQELENRLNDIGTNFATFTEDGQAIVRGELETNRFARLLVHFMEELKIRGGRHAFKAENVHLDASRYPNIATATALWRKRSTSPGSYVLKFGKLRYLQDTLARGHLRICPASYYNESSLNGAIRDDELTFTRQLCDATARIRDNQGNWHDATPSGPVRITANVNSDYYLSSYSVLFENRLFDDFEADCCLIVRQVDEYFDKLRHAFNAVLPGWIECFSGINYIDPYQAEKVIDVMFAKHIRYAYQREARIVWLPPSAVERLDPLHLELGDLTGCCELLTLQRQSLPLHLG